MTYEKPYKNRRSLEKSLSQEETSSWTLSQRRAQVKNDLEGGSKMNGIGPDNPKQRKSHPALDSS